MVWKKRKRISVRKIKEILRLKYELGLTARQIGRSCGISHATVIKTLKRAENAGLTWPLPEGMDDSQLERKLYPKSTGYNTPKSLPDMAWIHKELSKPGVTLQLLWEEYKADHPAGYQYTQFCKLYRRWEKKLDLVLRQTHKAGEKLFVDFAGQTYPVHHPKTGEIREAHIFVAVMGASSYAYAEAVWSEDLPSWISCHCRAFEYFGGVTQIVVPDNLKPGVRKPCRYEPDVNPTYQDLASHYGVAVIPAWVGKPKHKAKVESGVLLVERWILAALRNRTFFSLSRLNEAIAQLLKRLNNRPFKKLDGSRRSLFESIDKPALKPLPPERYEFAIWKKARVNIDYHVEADHNYYSVPYQLVKEEVDLRLTAATVEALYKGKRVASHKRAYGKGVYITNDAHRPDSHKRYLEWNPSRIIRWAKTVGPNTAMMSRRIMELGPHPEQGFRSCMGLISLSRHYSPERLEAACHRAIALGAFSYKSVKSILQNNVDGFPMEEDEQEKPPPIDHCNIRGPQYYSHGGDDSC